MRFLISALGSYGDVHPMVGLAVALRARGHRATIITNPHFESVVLEAGIEFVPLGTADEYDALAHHPHLWDPLRGPILVLKNGMNECFRALYELVEEYTVPGETVLVAHCLDLASRVYQELHGTPLASVHFAPICLRSLVEPPQMFGMLRGRWVPGWLQRLQYWMADRVVDRVVCPELNGFRREMGLTPVHRVMHAWYYSPQCVLGLFPDWFAPVPCDWPANTQLAGFVLWDQSSGQSLPEPVKEFLAAGTRPVVFAPGSAMTAGRWFFEAAVEVCQRLQTRGILLTRYREQLPTHLPDEVLHCDFVPFSQLLPHAAGIVHHGGIGTSAQALSAGLPQVVMPMAYDQLDNGTRLERLGVARILARQRFSAQRLTKSLAAVLGSESVRERAQFWARKMNAEDGRSAACAVLEQLGRTGRLPAAREEVSGG